MLFNSSVFFDEFGNVSILTIFLIFILILIILFILSFLIFLIFKKLTPKQIKKYQKLGGQKITPPEPIKNQNKNNNLIQKLKNGEKQIMTLRNDLFKEIDQIKKTISENQNLPDYTSPILNEEFNNLKNLIDLKIDFKIKEIESLLNDLTNEI